MGDFDKKAYDMQYQKDNYKAIKLAASKEQAAKLEEVAKTIGKTKSAYIKDLIDDDLTKRGLPPIFRKKDA